MRSDKCPEYITTRSMAVTGGSAYLLGVFWIGVATETYSKNSWSVLRGRESNARVKSRTLLLDLY